VANVASIENQSRPGYAGRATTLRPGLRAVVAMERLKLRKRPITWITFLLMTGGTAGIMVLGYLSIRSSGMEAEIKAANLANFILPAGIQRSFDIAPVLGMILNRGAGRRSGRRRVWLGNE
jgi:hypothetical protein